MGPVRAQPRTGVTVRCPAKINLGLEIGRRRPDGFHDLLTVFQTIGLYDELTMAVGPRARRESALELDCSDPELAGPSNLAARAARAVLEAVGAAHLRVRLTLVKRIPAGAGLGGGSSDAAAVLRTLPGLLGRRLGKRQLHEIGAALGSDVPFFLVGGRAQGRDRGTKLRPLPDRRSRALLLVYPGFRVSTAEAYRSLDESRERLSVPLTPNGFPHNIEGSSGGGSRRGHGRLRNDFEPVVLSAYPELARLKAVLTRAGASPALLSGSGSAMFGMFDTAARARQAAARIRRVWPAWQIWVTRTVSRR